MSCPPFSAPALLKKLSKKNSLDITFYPVDMSDKLTFLLRKTPEFFLFICDLTFFYQCILHQTIFSSPSA
jgi:hypothetical protein